jgi:hypothetical protein
LDRQQHQGLIELVKFIFRFFGICSMDIDRVRLSLVFSVLLWAMTIGGCDSKPATPSPDEIDQYVAEDPDFLSRSADEGDGFDEDDDQQ